MVNHSETFSKMVEGSGHSIHISLRLGPMEVEVSPPLKGHSNEETETGATPRLFDTRLIDDHEDIEDILSLTKGLPHLTAKAFLNGLPKFIAPHVDSSLRPLIHHS